MMENESNNACNGCIHATTRRDFIRDSALIVAGVLTAIGARPAAAIEAVSITPLSSTATSITYPVPVADGVSIDRRNEVVLTRWNGAVYAFALACPHQKTALRWIEGSARFQCPKHKSKYQPDGTFISGKATRGMDRYAIHRDGATIAVDTAVLHKQDVDPAGWAGAVVRVADGEK
jgi:Rieske Fe-S protein